MVEIRNNSNNYEVVFTMVADVRIRYNNRERLCRNAEITIEAAALLRENPNHIFSGGEVMMVSRIEDYYGSVHYKGRVCVRVSRM